MRAATFFLALIAVSTAASDFYLCDVKVPSFCATPPSDDNNLKRDTCMADPTLTMNKNAYDVTTGFNVITFGDFSATSKSEGRVLVGGNGQLSAGFSIGDQVYTKGPGRTDKQYPYSAVFGGKLSWASGRLYPDGSDQFASSFSEDMFVGSTFTGSSDLSARRTSNSESIGNDLGNAQSFYTQLSTYLNTFTDNVQVVATFGECAFTCASATADSYVAHVLASTLSSCTSYAFYSCATNVPMVINVPGTDNVAFASGAITPVQRDAAKTVFNILGSGRTISFKDTQFYGIILAPNNKIVSASSVTGIVITSSISQGSTFGRINCTVPTVINQASPCVSFEAACDGTKFTVPGTSIQGNTRDYNVISFGNFVADTGDVEGRVMTRGNFVAGKGYSIGYLLQTADDRADRHEAYSLLAGGSCTWGSGALYPDGSNMPYPGQAENIFCGDSFSGPSGLTDRATGNCGGSHGCINSIFDAAYQCYSGYSSASASTTTNVVASVEYSSLVLTCANPNSDSYTVNVDASLFNQFTYYQTSGCQYQAYWTINVVGTADVVISGGSFPAPRGAVLYNIPGRRTVYVYDTQVNGHILAVDATLNQTGGVILGKVVVGDVVSSLQINKEDVCDTITYTPVPLVPTTPTEPGTPTVCTDNTPTFLLSAAFESDFFPDGTVAAGLSDDNCVTMSNDADLLIAVGQKAGNLIIPSNAGGKQGTPAATQNGSASSIVVSIALLAVALLF